MDRVTSWLHDKLTGIHQSYQFTVNNHSSLQSSRSLSRDCEIFMHCSTKKCWLGTTALIFTVHFYTNSTRLEAVRKKRTICKNTKQKLTQQHTPYKFFVVFDILQTNFFILAHCFPLNNCINNELLYVKYNHDCTHNLVKIHVFVFFMSVYNSTGNDLQYSALKNMLQNLTMVLVNLTKVKPTISK